MHLVLPFALSPEPACLAVARDLRLPNLSALLQRLQLAHRDVGTDESWSTPAERELARLHGLPVGDGCIPWAAWRLQTQDRDPGDAAWADVTPCHWDVAASHISMGLTQQLALEEEESRMLLQSMQPYFAEDGIHLEYAKKQRWLARGELFRGMAAASLDRVCGADIDSWIPRTQQAKALRRLQNEMQMLLYTHPVNEARAARGLVSINSFWVSGCGALPALEPASAKDVQEITTLRSPALAGDWQAWGIAWQQFDSSHCATALAAARAGQSVALSLCGSRSGLCYGPQAHPAITRFTHAFRRQGLYSLHGKL